ncbi:hypothetical protein NC796_00415 [Aliifodinibius sp. S!AR15-10]|nr:hypothetical protein [Aliifodinibius sp. S!AR15-10]
MTYLLKGSWHGLVPPGQVYPKAKQAANQALTLDSTVADAHIALARIQHLYEWDWEAAEIAYKRGIELSPSTTFARILYANFLTSMGRFQESIKICRRILEIDPLSTAVYNELGFAHWHAGNSKKAIELINDGFS